jgi:hypothetical protein
MSAQRRTCPGSGLPPARVTLKLPGYDGRLRPERGACRRCGRDYQLGRKNRVRQHFEAGTTGDEER